MERPNEPAPEVRRLGRGDAGPLADFFEAVAADPEVRRYFAPHPLTRAFAEDLCARAAWMRDRYSALWFSGRVAGYSLLRGWDEGFEVPSFGACTHPGLRNAGAGQALLAHAVAEARAAGARRLRLTVYRSNARAAHVYAKFGFTLEPLGADRWLGLLDLESAAAVPPRPLDLAALRAWAAAAGPLPRAA
jgi:ribosomal-protein-alanine N-acetyltransferase